MALDLQAELESAVTAIKAQDWQTAEVYLLAASAALCGMPSDVQHGSERISFQNQIDNLTARVNRMKSAGRGIQQLPFYYAPAGEAVDESL